MTPQQCADDLVAKSGKVADIYDEGTLNEVIMEEIDTSIYHSLQHY